MPMGTSILEALETPLLLDIVVDGNFRRGLLAQLCLVFGTFVFLFAKHVVSTDSAKNNNSTFVKMHTA